MTVTINMPQMAANGLSENWVFRYCGDRHWQALCGSLSVRSSELTDDTGARLYPTFVAIRARYGAPLAQVRENDELDAAVDIAHFGQSFFHSSVRLTHPEAEFRLDMLTTFVSREVEGRNELRKSTPRSGLTCSAAELAAPPEILGASQAMRRTDRAPYDFQGTTVDLSTHGIDAACEYEPSPYADFNGANLLYFASYPTICDTLERRLVIDGKLIDLDCDWAMATSTVARDIFYYGNLDLGERLRARLTTLAREGRRIITHSALERAADGRSIADIFTARQILV